MLTLYFVGTDQEHAMARGAHADWSSASVTRNAYRLDGFEYHVFLIDVYYEDLIEVPY